MLSIFIKTLVLFNSKFSDSNREIKDRRINFQLQENEFKFLMKYVIDLMGTVAARHKLNA